MSRKKNQFKRHKPPKQYVPTKLPFNSAYGSGYLSTYPGMLFQMLIPVEKVKTAVSEIEIVKQPEPVIGWKIINLNWHRPYWEIQTAMGVVHDDGIPAVMGEARCGAVANTDPDRDYNGLSSEHDPKTFLICNCGFYAMKSHKGVRQDGWLAKVRLYGMVVEATKGYRATKQDILEVWAPDAITTYEEAPRLDQLKEQFPTIQWHLPARSLIESFTPKDMAKEVTHIHVDPLYDLLPKELVEQLLPSQYYQVLLPFFRNATMGLSVRFMTSNDGIIMEMYDYTNVRVLGPILFSGNRYHWVNGHGDKLCTHGDHSLCKNNCGCRVY